MGQRASAGGCGRTLGVVVGLVVSVDVVSRIGVDLLVADTVLRMWIEVVVDMNANVTCREITRCPPGMARVATRFLPKNHGCLDVVLLVRAEFLACSL